jgi:segregation and condensation protein B
MRRTAKLGRLEAALFVADGALSLRKLVQSATLSDVAETRQLIETLNEIYSVADSPFRIERVANGYQLLTLPEYAPWLHRIHQRKVELTLSPAALETLTIVAYHQPATRADVEAVRGVQCSEMLKQLMERNLVRIAGEDDSLGRPYLYETTRLFLEVFGLRSFEDLPMADRLRKVKRKRPEQDAPANTDESDADVAAPAEAGGGADASDAA